MALDKEKLTVVADGIAGIGARFDAHMRGRADADLDGRLGELKDKRREAVAVATETTLAELDKEIAETEAKIKIEKGPYKDSRGDQVKTFTVKYKNTSGETKTANVPADSETEARQNVKRQTNLKVDEILSAKAN